MTSRVYLENSRAVRQRVATQSPSGRLNVHGRTSSASNSLVRHDVSLSTHRVAGQSTEEEVRQRQMLKYCEDKVKFQQKEKEKADRKRAEKFQRYSHIDLGRKIGDLQVNDGDNDENMIAAREQQAAQYTASSPNALRIEQEREEMRVKREERKKEAKLKKYAHVTTGEQLSRDTIPNPFSPSQTSQNTASSYIAQAEKEEKEEEFRRQMKAARNRMQNQYDEKNKRV